MCEKNSDGNTNKQNNKTFVKMKITQKVISSRDGSRRLNEAKMFQKFSNCQPSNNLATEKLPFRSNQDCGTVCVMFYFRKDCLSKKTRILMLFYLDSRTNIEWRLVLIQILNWIFKFSITICSNDLFISKHGACAHQNSYWLY